MNVLLFQNVNQFRECRSHCHANLVFHAGNALFQHFLDDFCQILLFLLVFGLAQIHKHRHKGCLTVGGQQGYHLILNGLYAAVDFIVHPALHQLMNLLLGGADAVLHHFRPHLTVKFFPADLHKGCQMGQRNALSAVLVRCHLCDNLGSDIASRGERMGPLNHGAGNDGAVFQHVFQIHQIAVMHSLGVIVRVMEVNNAGVVGVHDFFRQQHSASQVLAHLACHIVTHNGVNLGVLIGVFLIGQLVGAVNQTHNGIVGGVCLTNQAPLVPIGDICPGQCIGAVTHNLEFHQVLNFLYTGCMAQFFTFEGDNIRNILNVFLVQPVLFRYRQIRLPNCLYDFCRVKCIFGTVPLDNFHTLSPSYIPPPMYLCSSVKKKTLSNRCNSIYCVLSWVREQI